MAADPGALCYAVPSLQANGSAPKARGVLGSFVSNLALRVVGSSALTADDLAPALADMKVGGVKAAPRSLLCVLLLI